MRNSPRADGAVSDIEAILAAAVARANTELARVEQIKRFAVADEPWLPGGDEVDPHAEAASPGHRSRSTPPTSNCSMQEADSFPQTAPTNLDLESEHAFRSHPAEPEGAYQLRGRQSAPRGASRISFGLDATRSTATHSLS